LVSRISTYETVLLRNDIKLVHVLAIKTYIFTPWREPHYLLSRRLFRHQCQSKYFQKGEFFLSLDTNFVSQNPGH